MTITVKIVQFGPDGTYAATYYKTFDVEAPEVETFLTQAKGGYQWVSICGGEIP